VQWPRGLACLFEYLVELLCALQAFIEEDLCEWIDLINDVQKDIKTIEKESFSEFTRA
jgi:hypothetical protein